MLARNPRTVALFDMVEQQLIRGADYQTIEALAQERLVNRPVDQRTIAQKSQGQTFRICSLAPDRHHSKDLGTRHVPLHHMLGDELGPRAKKSALVARQIVSMPPVAEKRLADFEDTLPFADIQPQV
jgi:hypothetical protein